MIETGPVFFKCWRMSRFNLTGWTDGNMMWGHETIGYFSPLVSSRHNVLHRFDGDHIQFNGNCSTSCIIIIKVLYPTIWYSNKLKMRIIIGYFNPIRRVLYVLQNKITECLLFKNGGFVLVVCHISVVYLQKFCQCFPILKKNKCPLKIHILLTWP